MFIGDLKNYEYVNFYENMEIEMYDKNLDEKINKFPIDNEILIITDLFGGTPFNRSFMKMSNRNINVITGLSLPMLLDIVMERDNYNTSNELLEVINNNYKEYFKEAKSLMEE